ncbi:MULTISPECIES: carbonic anhydrase family protein [unclassified Comamonas]|uniref:carbonic anhydrase family protein n=1 Tax=unclassified Comamonas TaxID=2638500 RepID=UPI000B08DA91|nr:MULTISPECIES: carbonic anhydrase family protein [unclassified Comamonas]MBN9331057.1 carbonic anhydrase [Comamonas sp.]
MPPHLNRRQGLQALTALATGLLAAPVLARNDCAVFTRETQAGVTPDAALKRLQEGNARFVAGETIHCDLRQQVRETAKGQAPFAAVVGCIDSRVPPELVFDQRIGDIFAARVAGNIVNDDILGSLEFATQLAGSSLIVVLGHTECGAIKGAVDDAKLGHLTGLLAQIRPSLAALKYEGVPSSRDKALVQRVAERNVQDTVARTARAPVLAARVQAGQLKVVGAMHDVATGAIRWMS